LPLKLACFDLDGLLVDTEPHYYEAHRAVWAGYGKELTKEYYARTWIIRGTRVADEVAKAGIPDDWEKVLEKVRIKYRALVEADLHLMPHARETLEAAKRICKTALVTNTPASEVNIILGRVGISGLLDFVVSRDKYERAKPEPDCYLEAMREAGTGPGEALALEDAPRGMRAAVAARVPVIAVVNEMTRYEPPFGAFMVLNSLRELDLDKLALNWPPEAAGKGK
jgi:HAD superfamily hydrolase (TIGR01509 family)